MADELQIIYQGASANIYVILRRPSDYKVWDVTNTTWATWSDGAVGDYDIALTDRSGDLYTEDFPTDITVGTRVIATFYDRAGASPAITDKVLDVADLTWDGAGVASGSSISLDSRALTSLASIKRHLGISVTTHDTVLTELINIVSDKIERFCGRRFAASDYHEWLDGDREQFFKVKHYPLIDMNRVASGSDDALTVKYTGSGIRANVSVYYDEEGENGGVRLRSFSTAGAKTENEITFASNASTNALVTAIGNVSDWTATEKKNVPSNELRPLGGQEAKDRDVTLTYADDQQDDNYYVDYPSGTLKFSTSLDTGWSLAARPQLPRGRKNVMIDYRAGYATIPDDVAGVCNEMVAEAFNRRTQNTALTSESLGSYSYSLLGPDSQHMQLMNRLVSYRQVPVGGLAK